MEDTREAYIILVGNLEGTRLLGRPKRRRHYDTDKVITFISLFIEHF